MRTSLAGTGVGVGAGVAVGVGLGSTALSEAARLLGAPPCMAAAANPAPTATSTTSTPHRVITILCSGIRVNGLPEK